MTDGPPPPDAAVDAYEARARQATARPPDAPFVVKTKEATFNHVTDFALAGGFLWRRMRDLTPAVAWQPLYFKEVPLQGAVPRPCYVHADGCNLIVVDAAHRLHYRKVVKEERDDKHDYHWQVCWSMWDWTPRWFSLPGISLIEDIVRGPILDVPKAAKAVCISHRGSFNYYVEDHVGQKHPVSTGVTSLYALMANQQDIRVYDPWAPKYSEVYLSLPDAVDSVFLADNMSASASVLMAIGYDCCRATGQKTLKVITRIADIDTEGFNPVLKYGFLSSEADGTTRIKPFQVAWKEHPFVLATGEPSTSVKLTRLITVLQTAFAHDVSASETMPASVAADNMACKGGGNNARELRVVGALDGVNGYFRKMLASPTWRFVPSADLVSTSVDAGFLDLSKPSPVNDLPPAAVRDYMGGTLAVFYLASTTRFKAHLHGFGPRSAFSTIHLGTDEHDTAHSGPRRELKLFRTEGVTHFIPPVFRQLAAAVAPTAKEVFAFRYDLVSDDPNLDEDLKAIFGISSCRLWIRGREDGTITLETETLPSFFKGKSLRFDFNALLSPK